MKLRTTDAPENEGPAEAQWVEHGLTRRAHGLVNSLVSAAGRPTSTRAAGTSPSACCNGDVRRAAVSFALAIAMSACGSESPQALHAAASTPSPAPPTVPSDWQRVTAYDIAI